MKMSDALAILGLGTQAKITKEEATKAYRRAAMKYHPDRNPAGTEMMKAVNEAWDYLSKLLEKSETLDNSSAASDSKQSSNFGEELNQALNAIFGLDGLAVEVCGAWVWVSGDTKPHKEALKQAGFKWASKKFMWYFRPENYRVTGHSSEWSMEKIRESYGSKKPTRNNKAVLDNPEAA